jgi:hypothetical protein
LSNNYFEINYFCPARGTFEEFTILCRFLSIMRRIFFSREKLGLAKSLALLVLRRREPETFARVERSGNVRK